MGESWKTGATGEDNHSPELISPGLTVRPGSGSPLSRNECDTSEQVRAAGVTNQCSCVYETPLPGGWGELSL